jgi:outer membrane protein OmpA-like peptidoglycan-associated protein
VLSPRDYENEKNRIKQKLAKSDGDSLPSSDVGYYMDVLQGRLKQVAGKDVAVTRQGEHITLDLTNRAAFDSDGTHVSAGFRDLLSALANVLVEYRMTLVSVRVRSGESGAQANHPRVADLHAKAVARSLADRARVELQVEAIVRAKGTP